MSDTWLSIPMDISDVAVQVRRTDDLARRASHLGPVISWYSGRYPAIVAGPALFRAVEARPPSTGLPWIRRSTGGGAVLAGPGLLGLDVALPATHPLVTADVIEDYRWFGKLWQRSLTTIGITSSVIGIREARGFNAQYPPDLLAPACFASLSPYEVVSSGKKIVGLAQLRRKGGVVFSAAVHLSALPLALAGEMVLQPRERERLESHLRAAAASLAEAAGRPIDAASVIDAIRRSLSSDLGVVMTETTWVELGIPL